MNTENKERKHSGLGIASFSISIVVIIVDFLPLIIAHSYISFSSKLFDDYYGPDLWILTLIISLVSLGLGIMGHKEDRKKILAILGIIFSVPLICISGCLIIFIFLFSQLS